MKIAHINNRNELQGWYDIEIHNSIPTPNIEVTDGVWQYAIDNGHNKVNEDGTTELFDFRTEDEVVEQDLKAKIAEAKAYLASTDWYITRLAERNIHVPVEITSKRLEAIQLLDS